MKSTLVTLHNTKYNKTNLVDNILLNKTFLTLKYIANYIKIFPSTHLVNNVDGAHEQLIDVSVPHHWRPVDADAVLETRPYSWWQFAVFWLADVQLPAQVPQADARQVVYLGIFIVVMARAEELVDKRFLIVVSTLNSISGF